MRVSLWAEIRRLHEIQRLSKNAIASSWPGIVLSLVFSEEIAEHVPEDRPVFLLLRIETQRFSEKHKVIFEAKETQRLTFSRQQRLDCQAVSPVDLSVNSRHEVIPILRALLHVYETPELRDNASVANKSARSHGHGKPRWRAQFALRRRREVSCGTR